MFVRVDAQNGDSKRKGLYFTFDTENICMIEEAANGSYCQIFLEGQHKIELRDENSVAFLKLFKENHPVRRTIGGAAALAEGYRIGHNVKHAV